MTFVWSGIVLVSLATSCMLNYYRNSSLYYRKCADKNEKSFLSLLELQSDSMFIAKKRCKLGVEGDSTRSLEQTYPTNLLLSQSNSKKS